MKLTLLGGENILAIDARLADLKQADPETKIVFADEFDSVMQITEFSGGLSLFGERTNQLIIRNIFQGSKSFIDSLLAVLEDKKYTFELVLVEYGNIDKRSRLYKYCLTQNQIVDCKPFNDSEKKQWLRNQLNQEKLTISSNVELKLLELLFSSQQQNPALELEKIVLLLNYKQRSVIELTDLQVLSPEWENTIWQLFSYGVLNKTEALKLFGRVWRENPIAPPLLGFLGSQLRQLISYYDFPEELSGFVKSRMRGLESRFSRQKVDLALRRLVSLEQSIKSSQIDPQLGIIMYLVSL